MRQRSYTLRGLDVPAIDVHGHFGDRWRVPMMAGGAAVVVRRAARAGVAWTIVSSLAALRPGRAAVLDGNQEALEACRRYRSLRMWAVLNPRHAASFRQVAGLLRDNALALFPAEARGQPCSGSRARENQRRIVIHAKA